MEDVQVVVGEMLRADSERALDDAARPERNGRPVGAGDHPAGID